MAKPLVSKKKADAISNGAFLVGLGILLYTHDWWPGILLVLWIAVLLRQYLTGRVYDTIVSTIILLGLFLVSFIKINWSVIIPILFVIGGTYLIFREYFYADESVENEILDERPRNANEHKEE
ncbi:MULTISPECIES: hypothetical protein [unclassified Neochlamydia]|uniref:hypothetical protein n=1 Tax=unclassified Neochlamydia TaxID=2643326 RepID=UPI00140E8B47|nr:MULTISPECIES: hypothetical protein [unclassified Neochlamydia]MBS4167173.1 Uncharacterized protein [Neochlamydia sp. AcF65]MBS4171406.1 Uncharacterized protein [Neochlamydia sp. AcF95]